MKTTNFSMKACGIRAGCLKHICQDDLFINSFFDNNGNEVLVGSVSDGCSSALGSENGSAFLVRAFAQEVENLGKDGNRDSKFMRCVALELLNHMAQYQPNSLRSEIENYHGTEVSHELSATLYGFVIDNDKTFMMLAGNGLIAINGHEEVVEQKGGDLYPVYALNFPKNEWPRRIEDIFLFAEFPTERIQSILIATDGFKHPKIKQHPGLIENPAKFILQAAHYATTEDPSAAIKATDTRKGDDATAIAFSRSGNISNPVTTSEVRQLREKLATLLTKKFDAELDSAKSTTVRKSNRTGSPMNDPSFSVCISPKDGVDLFGINIEDEKEYAKQQKEIMRRRLLPSQEDDDPFTALFGQQKSAPRATTNVAPRQQKLASTVRTIIAPARKKSSKIAPREIPVIRRETKKTPPIQEILPTPLLPVIEQEEKMPEMPASKARTQVEKPKQKLPQEKWIPFQELFTQRDAKKHSIGFRHFGQVMHDLWHFVENYHQQGIRIGNLRPWDLSIRISKGSESSYAFRLNNPDLVAKVDAQGDLVRAYSELDINFIHPEYLPLLNWDDTARLNQDWYAYGVLSYWFVTKYDPFGEGIVKAKPEADRIYRMEKAILSQSSRIETEEKKWRFIERAIGRLGTVARSYIQAFVSRKNFNREPEILLEEFRQEKILTCKAEIFKLGRNSTLRKTRSRCGFKQLTGFNYCIYCDTQHVKLLTT